MALETLKGIDSIGGFDVVVMDDLREKYPEKFNESGAMDYKWFEKEIRPNNFVYVRNDKNSIAFTIQNGPIKEVGVNGCQIDTMIEAVKIIVEEFDKIIPHPTNITAIEGMNMTLEAFRRRKKEREERNVEGTMKE